jgi:hypothetical protein
MMLMTRGTKLPSAPLVRGLGIPDFSGNILNSVGLELEEMTPPSRTTSGRDRSQAQIQSSIYTFIYICIFTSEEKDTGETGSKQA